MRPLTLPLSAPERGLSLIHVGLPVVVGAGVGLLAVAAVASSSLAPWAALAAVLAGCVAIIAGSLRRVLIALVILDIPFQWEVNFNYRPEAAQLGALGGLSVSVTTMALGGLYGIWIAEALAGRGHALPLRISGALLVFTGATAASALVARDTELATFEVALLVEMLLLFLYVAGTVRSLAEVRFIMTVLFVGVFVEGIIVILAATGHPLPLPGSPLQDQAAVGTAGLQRTGGTIGSPNAAGSFFSFLLVPAVTVLATPLGKYLRAAALLALTTGTVALILTFSRGGWLAFAASVVILAVGAWRRGSLSPRVPLAAALGVVALTLPFYGVISERLTGRDEGAAAARLPLMKLATRVIEDQPLLGVGANNFAEVIPDYAGPEFTSDWIYVVHNKFLQVWAEAGGFALLAFLAFALGSVRRGWRSWRADHPVVSPLALGLSVALIGQLVAMTVETYHGRPQVQLLWLVAALIAALSSLETGAER